MNTFKTLSLAIIAAISFNAHADALKVGSMGGKEATLVQAAQKVAKDKYGLDVEVVEFDDYVTPNVALADGDIDANAFQHKPYLDSMNEGGKLQTKLVPVAKTFVYPIGAYSKKIKDIKELKDGAIIAIPNDPSNEARTLILLDKTGLIKLKDPNNLQASVLDIAENPHNFDFMEVEAAQLPRTLKEVDIAFINSNFAVDNGLTPTKDAILREAEDSPYMNVIAVRKGDENREDIKTFIKAYQSPEVEKAAEESFKGAAVKGW